MSAREIAIALGGRRAQRLGEKHGRDRGDVNARFRIGLGRRRAVSFAAAAHAVIAAVLRTFPNAFKNEAIS